MSDDNCATIGDPLRAACTDGRCGCLDDQAYADAGDNGDVCRPDGRCGCRSDADCGGVTHNYDGGAIECVPSP